MNLLAGNPLLRVAPATLPPPITVLVRCDKRRERPILQTHGFPAPRFQRWPRASVPPISLPDSAACHGVVDILDPIPYALNQFSDALPVAAAKPCRSCGGWKIHHPWCPTLGLNVRTAFHPKEDGKSWTIQLAGSSPPSFGGFA